MPAASRVVLKEGTGGARDQAGCTAAPSQQQQHKPTTSTTAACHPATASASSSSSSSSSLPHDMLPLHDDNDDRFCRICYGEDSPKHNQLFQPCLCRGSMALVHPRCLALWRRHGLNPQANTTCTNCCYSYRVELNTQQGALRLVLPLLLVTVFALVNCTVLPIQVSSHVLGVMQWNALQGPARHVTFAASFLLVCAFWSQVRASIECTRGMGRLAYVVVLVLVVSLAVAYSSETLRGGVMFWGLVEAVVPAGRRTWEYTRPWMEDDCVLPSKVDH